MGGAVSAATDEQVVLQALDPELLSEVESFVFSFSKTRTCAQLVDLGPEQIGALLEDERPPIQVLPGGATAEHVFGLVEPGVPVAYFVFASSRPAANERLALADFAGTVFAMGCTDHSAQAGTRRDLPLQLFPVGLR